MMKSKRLFVLAFCFSMLFIGIGIAGKKNNPFLQSEKQWQPGVVIVKMKSSSQSFQKISNNAGLLSIQSKYGIQSAEQLIKSSAKKKSIGREELERIFIFKVSKTTDIQLLAHQLLSEPSVEYAEPNYILQSHSLPNDPLFTQVYPLGIVKADTAWSIQKGDSTVVIGIIDTGVDWDHPDLASSIWNNAGEIPGNNIDDDGNGFIDDVRGWDFLEAGVDAYPGEDSTTQDNDPMDFNGHGTHVAGIAAGTTNNGVGISSLSWGCKIMPLRIGWHNKTGSGIGYSADMAKAFVYAADNGASVCNLSYSTTGAVLDGALYAYKNGVVIVNSAGNSNSDEVSLLGAQSWALAVAATNSNDQKASYSSYHNLVDVSAPGGDFSSGNFLGFLSTIVYPSNFYGNNQYVQFQGTSMASPFVASLAGLIKSQHKDWTPAQIMFQIVGTADDIDSKNSSYVKKLGSGRINAFRALTEAVTVKPKMKLISVLVDESNGGNGNGLLDPGETVHINCIIRNEWGDATNVTAVLSSDNPNISIEKSNTSYGSMFGISNLDSSQRGSTDGGFTVSINANALPQSIAFKLNLTASGGYTTEFPFELKLSAKLLFVDDDDGINNIEQYYYSALNRLGIVYEIWDRNTQGELPFDYLQKYKTVIWACEWAFPALDASDRNVLTAYLTGGGSLFMSGQDIGWDLADPSGTEVQSSLGSSKTFYEKFLKAKYISDDAKNNTLVGISGNNISDTMSIVRNQPGRASTEQFPDVIDTINGSNYLFLYNGGDFNGRGGAISYAKEYKLVYFGFGGFESIVDSNKRNISMKRIITFLNPEIIVSAPSDESLIQKPFIFSLEQNYPNPFNPSTTIRFAIRDAGAATLKVYDIIGREVTTLINEKLNPGNYEVPFNASTLSNGIYFYRLTSGNFVETKKMALVK